MRLLFFLAVWQRPQITEICFMGLDRIRKWGKFDVEVFAVISEEEMIPLCEKYDVKYCFHENQPLGKKKNYGLQQALKLDFDYLIEIGSDDLVKNELLEAYEPFFKEKVPMLGISDFTFINSFDGEVKHYKATGVPTFGLGRAFRKDILQRFEKGIWPDNINKGLDNASHFFLAWNGVLDRRIKSEKPLAVDIKSQINIWPFESLPGSELSFDDAVEGLSIEEVNAIKDLMAPLVAIALAKAGKEAVKAIMKNVTV